MWFWLVDSPAQWLAVVVMLVVAVVAVAAVAAVAVPAVAVAEIAVAEIAAVGIDDAVVLAIVVGVEICYGFGLEISIGCSTEADSIEIRGCNVEM